MKKILFALVLFVLVGQFAMAADGMIKPAAKKNVIAANKFDSYQISIKKVDAPVATTAVPTYTIKQSISTTSFYRVTFWNTCGFYEDLPMTCDFCSDEQLIETARDLVIARNVAICNQIPTYMIFQIIES